MLKRFFRLDVECQCVHRMQMERTDSIWESFSSKCSRQTQKKLHQITPWEKIISNSINQLNSKNNQQKLKRFSVVSIFKKWIGYLLKNLFENIFDANSFLELTIFSKNHYFFVFPYQILKNGIVNSIREGFINLKVRWNIHQKYLWHFEQ